MNKSERGGNIFDYIEMAKQVTIKREQGVNQDVEYLDYMNKVPRSNQQKDWWLGESLGQSWVVFTTKKVAEQTIKIS